MANVLVVAAGELCYPVVVFILVIAGDGLLHNVALDFRWGGSVAGLLRELSLLTQGQERPSVGH